MVVPTTFGFDEQTAKTNTFQHHLQSSPYRIRVAAMAEFEAYVAALRAHDIAVHVFTDTDDAYKPNAIFPNNWLSTWPDGTIYTYPMATASRRAERSEAALDLLRDNFKVPRVVDLSASEQHGRHLEGTGAIVFDHANRIGYACLSARCDESLFTEHMQALGYTPWLFHATDKHDTPIYHTNVLLNIQEHTVVVCSDSIHDRHRAELLTSLGNGGRQIIDISYAQMLKFCGNVLGVKNIIGEPFIILSRTAYDVFTPAQRRVLATSGTLLPVAIPTIETIGGGSARCMLAEIFLPRA